MTYPFFIATFSWFFLRGQRDETILFYTFGPGLLFVLFFSLTILLFSKNPFVTLKLSLINL
jgi:hypothetical protein